MSCDRGLWVSGRLASVLGLRGFRYRALLETVLGVFYRFRFDVQSTLIRLQVRSSSEFTLGGPTVLRTTACIFSIR